MATDKEKGTVKKFWLFAIFAAIGTALTIIFKMFYVDSRDRYKGFTPTDDPTVVKDDTNGKTVVLPKTKTEGQVTSKNLEAVEAAKETSGEVQKSHTEKPIGSAGSADVPSSAGESLFGKRTAKVDS